MTDQPSSLAIAVLLMGVVAVIGTPVRAGLARIGLPDIVGYVAIGLALAAVDERFAFLSSETRHGLDTLAAAGVVALLFRAGLESHPKKLMRQLPRASLVLIGDIAVSAGLGYAAARYLIGIQPLPALFVAVALSATSVGVSIAIWRQAGAIDTEKGALLLDVAELDDVAGVLLLAVLLVLAPIAHDGADGRTTLQMLVLAGWLVLKLAMFLAACLLFAGYVEERLTRWLRSAEPAGASIIPVAGLAFIIAALADQLGFSLAIGALFAGLAFSRDPGHVRLDKAFDTLFRLFVPFFFVGIGLDVAIASLPAASVAGAILLVAAIVGKTAGNSLPLVASLGGGGALLIGVSMVPRAEITMIVMERGRALGEWAVPSEVYGAVVIVALGTCLLTPPVISHLLQRAKKGEKR